MKQKVLQKDKDEIGPDTPNPDWDMDIDNKKEKIAQELEGENLDLVIENDDWAASLASSLSLYKKNKVFDSANDRKNEY